MLFKPRYCCHCGEEIDRVDWKLWTSNRFCELCETEFVFREWGIRISFLSCLVFALLFFGGGLFGSGRPEDGRPPNLKSDGQKNLISEAPIGQPEQSNRVGEKESEGENSNTTSSEKKQTNTKIPVPNNSPVPKNGGGKLRLRQKSGDEAVYFCGAETKKGTPCSRRVKGGGRCWQHKGMEPMLPEDELRISQ